MLQCVTGLNHVADRFVNRQRPLVRDKVADVYPFNEFKDDEVPTVFFADGIDASDIGVIQPRRALGFVAEASQCVFVRLVPGNDFDRDDTIERRIDSAEDGAPLNPRKPEPRDLPNLSIVSGSGLLPAFRGRATVAPRPRDHARAGSYRAGAFLMENP